MDPLLISALLLLGACTGFVAGLLGIGGGMLMVPFMTMLLGRAGVPDADIVKVAIATSLTTVLFTSMSSVRAHHRRGAVRWILVRALAPGILIGALAGAQLAGAVPWRVLAGFFGLFIGYSAMKMLAGPTVRAAGELPGSGGLFAAGSGIGILSALLGAGGGFITVPYLERRLRLSDRARRHDRLRVGRTAPPDASGHDRLRVPPGTRGDLGGQHADRALGRTSRTCVAARQPQAGVRGTAARARGIHARARNPGLSPGRAARHGAPAGISRASRPNP
jgi:hypothetical protein